jgi:hypothetical protein
MPRSLAGILLFVAGLGAACAASGGGPGSDDDDDSGDDTRTDAGPTDGGVDIDVDAGPIPDDALRVSFVGNLDLCPVNALPAGDPDGTPRYRARIAPVNVLVPTDGIATVDFVNDIVIDSAGTAPQATSDGELRVFPVDVPDENGQTMCGFQFVQFFNNGARDFLVMLSFFQLCTGGSVVELRPEQLFPISYFCDSPLPSTDLTFTISNGDQLVLREFVVETCALLPQGMAGICPSYAGDVLAPASFTHAAVTRTIDDSMALGLLCGHHMGPVRYGAVLSPPLGGIARVVVELEPDNPVATVAIRYLDEEGIELEALTATVSVE